MGDGSYTFGDSALAATRLALLADVFQRTTDRFLRSLQLDRHRLAVDLGCGPGFTTGLLRDALAVERVIGIDSSAGFVSEAAHRVGPGGEVLCADVRDLPAQVHDADAIFARFLLTHLSEPSAAIEHWCGRLSAGGVLALEEVESIATDEPVLERYLDLQRQMLRANNQRLDIGPVIEDHGRANAQVLTSNVISLTPATETAAQMFGMNFASWRTRSAVAELATRAELDEIQAGLNEIARAQAPSASITWQLRQITLRAS